jgi:hypothetical protein
LPWKKLQRRKSNIAALHRRKFTQAQIAYHTTDQECLAVVDALKAFQTRLPRIPFTVNHRPSGFGSHDEPRNQHTTADEMDELHAAFRI